MKASRILFVALLGVSLVVTGCAQRPAEESASEQPAKSGAAKSGGTRTGGTGAARPAPAPPPAAAVTIPSGTPLEVSLITGLSSKDNKAGDVFVGSLNSAVVVDGKSVIPKGADVTGRVTKSVASGRLKERAELWLTLTEVKISGKTYTVSTSTTGQKEGSKATRDVLFIGGGAGAGAAIGGAVGGGKGAGIGAAIGAAAGTAGAMATGQRDIKFPPETVLRFTLEQELKVS